MPSLYQYPPEILKALQKTELEMLKKVDTICRKYEIKYFLAWGSMLGAVRHHGFIPWDDDIDIGMLREDYERLRQVPKEEWEDLYELVDPSDNNILHRYAYPQLYKKDSVFVTEYHYKHDHMKNNPQNRQMPIWLDIFLFDRIADVKAAERRWRKVWLLGKLYYYAKCRITSSNEDSLKYKLINFGKTLTFYILNLFQKPEQSICKGIKRLCTMDEGDYVGVFYTTHRHHMLPCPYDDVFPLLEVPFEDMTSFVPKNYDRMMRNRYGKHYMELPPVSARVNHPPYILNLGNGIGDLINQNKL